MTVMSGKHQTSVSTLTDIFCICQNDATFDLLTYLASWPANPWPWPPWPQKTLCCRVHLLKETATKTHHQRAIKKAIHVRKEKKRADEQKQGVPRTFSNL